VARAGQLHARPVRDRYQTNFKEDGQNLQAFLQMLTSNPVIAGGSLAVTDIVLNSVPAWETTVPAGATAYDVSFTALQNKTPNSRNDFIEYASQGTWLMLGNQRVAKTNFSTFEGDNNGAMCSGVHRRGIPQYLEQPRGRQFLIRQ
jgi:hypothetical protein